MPTGFFPYVMLLAGVVSAIFIAWTAVKALVAGFRTKRLPWRGGELHRQEKPVGFWMMVAVYLFLGTVCIFMLLFVLVLVLDRAGIFGARRANITGCSGTPAIARKFNDDGIQSRRGGVCVASLGMTGVGLMQTYVGESVV